MTDAAAPASAPRTPGWRMFPDRPDIGWTPWFYLVYVSFLVFGPLLGGVSWTRLGPEALAILAFLPLYRAAWWVQGRRLVPILLGMVVLGLLIASRNPGAANFFIYAAAFSPGLGSTRRAIGAIALLVIVQVLATWLLGLHPFFWGPGIVFTVLIGGLCIHQREIQEAHEALRLSREETSHLARVAERERIARDLHDLLGHTLSLVAIKSELAAKLAERDPTRAAAEIRDVERISREALREVRSAVAGYRSRSLAAELEQAASALGAAGVTLETELPDGRLSPLQEGVLSLVVREAITNVMRHSGASRCRVTLAAGDDGIRLEVADDGRGAAAPEGSGLQGIRERVRALGGAFERVVADGTRLIVTLPPAASEHSP